MAQPQFHQVKLSRFDAQPWGFRLQGGTDFAAPLLVQKVNGGSLAEQAGLLPGDAVIKINDVDVFNLRHKDAQDIVVRSGNNFVITVQRGGSTWRPHVTPTGHLPQPNQNSPYLQTVTKTSLAHKQQEVEHIGCGYNNAARPFVNGGDGSVKSIVNKQYNTPVGIYSDESIAETLSAQAEVLAGGVLGVNFKKNEKEYQAEKSEVLKFLREEETGQSTPAFNNHQYQEPQHHQHEIQHRIQHQQQQQHQHPQQQHHHQQAPQQQQPSSTRHVSAPINAPKPPSTGGLPTGQNICAECERLITHAIGGNERKPPQHHQPQPKVQDERVGMPLQQHTLAPDATHRPSLPVASASGPKPATTFASAAAATGPETHDPRVIMMPVCPALQGPEYKAEMDAANAALAKGDDGPRPLSASGHPPCQQCGVGIVGVFVRIKDKNLHVECFKCATCGTSLKNQGYYNFNNKLYCDIHAKLAALQNPPAGTEGYVPVPIKPNTKLSTNTIVNALSSHGYNNGYANGNSTPTPTQAPAPASHEENNELPLPPPPSPTQLQQYELDTQLQYGSNPQQHSRTHSSLSSVSSSSTNTNTSSMSPVPLATPAGSALETSSSTVSLDRYLSSMHSHQTSSSTEECEHFTPPPPPPLPTNDSDLYISSYPKHHNNNCNTKMLQQQAVATKPPQTNNAYNKLLKEYSNKLLTQTNNNGHENTTANTLTHNNNNYDNKLYNGTAKPFTSGTQQYTIAPAAVVASPAPATVANQLKSNPRQVASPVAITSVDQSSNFQANSDMSASVVDGQSLYGQINASNPANTVQSASSADQPFEYVTLTGNVIRSVVPPGKGANINYKVNQGYARPFGAAPPAAAPKSPISYPPQTQNWGAPQQQPKPAVNPYATLPRSNVGQQGRNVRVYSNYGNNYSVQYRKPRAAPTRYSTIPSYHSSYNYNNNQNSCYNYNNQDHDEGLQPQYADVCYSDEPSNAPPNCFEYDAEVAASNAMNRVNFVWPPPKDDEHETPTAAPLYIPPPETQHVTPKYIQHPPPPPPGTQQPQFSQQTEPSESQEQPEESQACQWQSRSAPQLTCAIQAQCESTESSSDSYTSTSTTTTTTSEEYQRMYAAQVQAYQMQQAYEQSGSELDYHMDMEVAGTQNLSCSSYGGDFISGRRSAQDCVDSLANPLSTYKLVDMVREVTPSPAPTSQGPKHVVFLEEPEVKEIDRSHAFECSDNTAEAVSQQMEALENIEETDETGAVEEEGLVIAERCEILESQRFFQPTPEIKIEIAPVRHIPPTKIPNPMPKEWINPMVRVLTTAPEVPFHMVDCPCPRPCDCSFDVKPEQQAPPPPPPPPPPAQPQQLPEPLTETAPFLRESPPGGTRLSNAMSTAPEFEVRFAPAASEMIPLPAETEPYMPPPIEMKPYLREDYRPKTPLLSALTTAPDKPFEGHFERDVPIHILDLPTPKERLTMSDALRTAPERAYTPLNPENATHRYEEQAREQEKQKYEFQVLDHEEELGLETSAVEYYTTDNRQRKSSAFAAMQAFQPSREPLTTSTPRNSLSSISKDETDLDYQKFCKAKERNQKRLSFFQKKEEELQQQQTEHIQQQTHQIQEQTEQIQQQTQQIQQLAHQIQEQSRQIEQQQQIQQTEQIHQQQQSQKIEQTHQQQQAQQTAQARQQQQMKKHIQKQDYTETNSCQTSSLASCNKQCASFNSSSAVQQLSTATTSAYVSNSTQASSMATATKVDAHEIIEETSEELEHSEVLFPPPSPLSHLKGKAVPSGLHKADQIPKYQRNWTVLPSQSPARTPEPQELRDNVPLAFVDAPKTPSAVVSSASNPVHRPVAQISTHSANNVYNHLSQQTTAAARGSITSTTSVTSGQQRVCEEPKQRQPSISHQTPQPKLKQPMTVPIIVEDCGPVTMAFQSLDEHLQHDQYQPPSRPYTPSLTNKPAPIVPFYQTPEKLCFDECPATHARDYDRRSASPFPDRARSPAPGPPPNPLSAIRAPRMKDSDPTPATARMGSITTGQSYLGVQQAQQQQGQLLSHHESSTQSGMQSYTDKPATYEERKIGDLTIQKREKETQMAEQQQRQQQSQTTTQVGNAQIERRRRVTEQYEHTQKAKTIEIRTGGETSSTERRQSYGKTGYVANQARRLSNMEQEISSLTTQSQAISARAAHMSDTFPHFKSPEPVAKFPLKPVLPPFDEPTAPNYICMGAGGDKRLGPPPGFQGQQQQQEQQMKQSQFGAVYGQSLASTATSQQQQQQQITSYNATSSSTSSQAILTKASSATNNKAYAAANATCASNQLNSASTGVCPVTGTYCRPGHTCCKQTQLQMQPQPTAATAGSRVNNNNNNSAIRPPASTEPPSLTKPPSATNATLPRQPNVATHAANTNAIASPAHHAPPADLHNDEATAMLTESIGKINMGEKMDNFMAEAGKIISNMLEARLANNGGQTLSNSGSALSLLSNSSSNLSKSPMVVRKRFDLEDFKDIDPTEPMALKPVVAVPQALVNTNGQKAQPQVPRGVQTNLLADMPAHHPMGKVIDICDSKQREQSPIVKNQPLTPVTSPLPVRNQLATEETLAPLETVVFRSNKDKNTRLSTHAMDRRSYIEPNSQLENSQDDLPFSVSVKALGGPKSDPNAPMSPENEAVVSQLLKDGKRPICCQCNKEVTKGPFITALGRIWCPEHFICVNANCRRPLQDIGFVEEKGDLYCEYCFEKYLAPSCSKCGGKIKGDCLNAIGKHFHPECFTCGHCGKLFGNTPFFLEDGNAYCEADWNELFTTKCYACGFPVEAGDRWVEALSHNYHSQCFNCTYCKQNLEGQSFYNKGGRPFCKNHAR